MNRFYFSLLQFLVLSLSISFFLATPAFSAVLPPDEVDTLRVIGATLGKSWNFIVGVDPCGGTDGWVSKNDSIKGFENILGCNCTFNESTVCHVVNISLKSQSLQGTLPPQIASLPYLEQLDLTRNYLSGSIPREWGNSTSLLTIALQGNRLTGTVPKELGKILTLQSLDLETNQLSGNLPPELGSLSSLQRLLLTSNNFTGELPGTFVGLTSLLDIRLGDNQFTGQIPNFIQSWTNLDKMVLQASGLTGPIPSGISLLSKMTDLRISDLTGSAAPFPPISNMTKLKVLILRSCNITGRLPDYLVNMAGTLKNLDLSFNKLQGPIPSGYDALQKVNIVILTGNMLNGSVPDWMLQGTDSYDISYNNFSIGNNRPSSCQQKNVNVFAATENGNSSIVSCLGKDRCAQTNYSLRINCGGKETTINGTKIFGDDTSVVRKSRFVESIYNNWGISNTGIFMDDTGSSENYISENSYALSMTTDPELYTTARRSALSLTYYGYCLGNGLYTVHLHFAEIMFTNDKTFSSLGRRIFNVYIQGKLVLENFNIVREAGGVGMAVVESFPVNITDGTLEIRFYWAGKGTLAIPGKGVYGPLISAISVDPDFEPPKPSSSEAPKPSSSMSAEVVVGIVTAVLVMILLILGILWWKGCIGKKKRIDEDLRGLDLQTSSFTLRQIRAATNNFDSDYKIGEGGFGPVYKGLLADGTIIAVKQLSSKSKQGNREFINEIGMISALQHPNLVKLYGCCIEGNQLLLIYEYLENNSLARALFGLEEHQLKLEWRTRYNICIGIARGLAYLHEESRLKIVHRDIKATNVLLDKNLEPKISDFGLAKLDEEGNTHISTRVAGTFGYMAPEYAMRGYLTDKADVYSFGIVALEIVSGRSNTSYRPKEECFYLLDWTLILKEKSSLLDLVDERLGSDFDKNEAMVMINLGLQCTNVSPAVRPLMSNVVSMLEGRVLPKETVPDPNASKEAMNAMWRQYQREKESRTNDSQNQSISLDAPCTSSAASAVDLYPIKMDSAYLNNRE